MSGSGSGNGEITVTAEHVTVEGNKVILEGDVSESITISGQEYSGSSTVASTFTEVVKVTDAGQSKVKGA